MKEQPDLFPKDAEKAEKLKETDILYTLKKRHKGTQAIREGRRLIRRLTDKSNARPNNPNSVIIRPKYK